MKKRTSPTKRPSPAPRSKTKFSGPPAPVPKIKSLSVQSDKEKQVRSYWQKCRFYILAFVGALIVFGLCIWLIKRQVLVGKEVALFRRINDLPETLRTGFVIITTLGSFWTAAVSVVAAFILRLYQLAWRSALSIFTAYGLLLILKEFFARQRPEQFIPDLHVRVIEASYAFPSAHAAIATVLALTLRTYLPIPAVWQWLVVLLWVGGVAFSRVYLGVHTPLDVAAGVALGVGVVSFWRIMPKSVKRILRLK